MSDEAEFYTATMARVYADQGYLSRAAEIYRHLLKQDPQRLDLLKSLSAVEDRLAQLQPQKHEELVHLFSRWFDLMLESNRLHRLKKLQQYLK